MTRDAAEDLHAGLEATWRTPPGWRALSGVNHTSVGLRFIVTGFAFFLIAGVLSMLMRAQLATPYAEVLDASQYNAAFTLHGTLMMFFFAVPIMEGFAVYLLPKMIGARDLVFPRLSAFGYWCYLLGGTLLLSSLVVGTPPDSGWFMYTPLSSKPWSDKGADFWLLGVTFAEISAVSAAIELIVSILRTRTAGMAIQRMPLFAWYMLVTAVMIVFAFPPLILGSILLEIERAFGLPFFDPARGGDPLLWQHLFWLFGHPEVYIIFLPAAGIVSTIVPTFARRPMDGYVLLVLAVLATGFLSFGLWVHHMFTTGIPLVSLGFFAAASMAVAIPSGIQVFAWIATLWNGRPVLGVPLLFILGFLFVFVLGGLTGVMVAFVPFDWQVHDTHFVVAHLHYVLFGGMVFPMFAGLYYWLPLVAGRVSEASGRVVFWLIFGGFNLTFLPMHLTGLLGMPRRVYTYDGALGWELLNLVSTIGGFITAIGVGAFLVDFLSHLRYGRHAERNVWEAGTLEWAMRTPVPPYNFASQPDVKAREPLWDDPTLAQRAQRGEGWLGQTGEGRREMLATSSVDAKPEQVIVLPGNTWLPLVAALCVGLFFLGMLLGAYLLAAAGAAASAIAFLAWAWRDGDRRGGPDEALARGAQSLPLHYASPRPPGWYGLAWTLSADAAMVGALGFAYVFLWTVRPDWLPAHAPPGALQAAVAAGCLLASSVAAQLGARALASDRGGAACVGWGAAMLLALAWLGLDTHALFTSGLSARAHAYGAIVHTLWGMSVFHVAVGLLMAGFLLARRAAGRAGPHRPGETRIVTAFWHYAVAVGVLAFVLVRIVPWVGGGAG